MRGTVSNKVIKVAAEPPDIAPDMWDAIVDWPMGTKPFGLVEAIVLRPRYVVMSLGMQSMPQHGTMMEPVLVAK